MYLDLIRIPSVSDLHPFLIRIKPGYNPDLIGATSGSHPDLIWKQSGANIDPIIGAILDPIHGRISHRSDTDSISTPYGSRSQIDSLLVQMNLNQIRIPFGSDLDPIRIR